MTGLEWVSDHSSIIIAVYGTFISLYLLAYLVGSHPLWRKRCRTTADDAERELFLRSYQYKTSREP